MNLIETKFNIDIDNEQQLEAYNAFIKALKGTNGQAPTITAPVKDIKSNPPAQAATVTHPATTAAATQASAPAIQPAAITAPSTGSNKLDAIRKLIGEKAGAHREAMKAELTRLGAETATDLTVDNYEGFHKFLEAL